MRGAGITLFFLLIRLICPVMILPSSVVDPLRYVFQSGSSHCVLMPRHPCRAMSDLSDAVVLLLTFLECLSTRTSFLAC